MKLRFWQEGLTVRVAVRDEFIAASLKRTDYRRGNVFQVPVRDEFIAASLKPVQRASKSEKADGTRPR